MIVSKIVYCKNCLFALETELENSYLCSAQTNFNFVPKNHFCGYGAQKNIPPSPSSDLVCDTCKFKSICIDYRDRGGPYTFEENGKCGIYQIKPSIINWEDFLQKESDDSNGNTIN